MTDIQENSITEQAAIRMEEPEDVQQRVMVSPRAGFWMRFWAYSIDFLIVGSISRLFIKPLFRLLDIPIDSSGFFSLYTVVDSIVFFGYFFVMTLVFSQTLGKMVMGLHVISLTQDKLDWKTLLFREWIGRYISAFFLLGYIIVAFNPKKQGFHDLFSDTAVVLDKER